MKAKRILCLVLSLILLIAGAGYHASVMAEDNTKTAVMDKTTYTTEEVITVRTTNWESGEFIRIYKKPVTGYNTGVLADTHSTVWKKSEYKFYPKNWEPGSYQMIAFDSGSGWPRINAVDFTITAPEVKEYTISGDTLTVNQNTVIDFKNIKPEEKEGKLFIGWKTQSGDSVKNNTEFKKGTVLQAQYISYNAENTVDFKVISVGLRAEPTFALKFVVEQSKKLYKALPNRGEYGIAVLPSVILNENSWAELTLDGVYTYGSNTYTPSVVKAEKVEINQADKVKYNVCITGIEGEKLSRQYTVRGYIKYTDLNGISRVLYTDYSSANPYEVAKSEISNAKVSESVKLVAENIVSTVNKQHSDKYAGIEKETIKGSPANLNTYIYQLKDNGLYVREAEINIGLDKPVVITQLSDLHFNYLNKKDWEEKNPTVMSTYDMRELAKDASSVNQTRNAVDFAKTSDAVVVTGDIFDYLSWGGIELMNKEVWDIIPDAIMSIGNHEYEQKMLGVMPEIYTIEERFGMLDNVWRHNVDYYSRVISDKVMLIQLNNGQGKFYDGQLAPLEADINVAREKGYAVLLFMHEPLCTGNPSESSVAPILQNHTGKSNFYTSQVGGNNADSATLAVCNLIKSSADVVKGVFNGHMHSDYYTEIVAKDKNGVSALIPQYTSTGGFYDNGHVIKITVK